MIISGDRYENNYLFRNVFVHFFFREKVVLVLTYFGEDWDIAQRVEVTPTNDKTFANQFRINRLFDFEQDVPKAEAACRK